MSSQLSRSLSDVQVGGKINTTFGVMPAVLHCYEALSAPRPVKKFFLMVGSTQVASMKAVSQPSGWELQESTS